MRTKRSIAAFAAPRWYALSLGCALSLMAAATVAKPPAGGISQADLTWLQRIGFGIDSADLERFRQLGRRRYLEQQLDPHGDGLPPRIAAQITHYEASQTPITTLIAELRDQRLALNAMPDGDARRAEKKRQRQRANALLQEAQQSVLLHAIYGRDQLREQMVWFWLNHFSVFRGKGSVRTLVADYVDTTIRPHALGKFRDLVMATLQSPAMLVYLDNAQNAKGHANENYARELMELHTLGVDAGYTQQDVQQLARVLTGAGIDRRGKPPRVRREWQPLVVIDGAFEFNPARHDFGEKVLLGRGIHGRGFAEITEAVDRIVKQPACATFISRQIAEYLVGDTPPPSLVAAMAKTFTRTDGDIGEVLRTLFESPAITTGAGKKFKDPMQFVVSSMRIAYDGTFITNPKPLVNWLDQLGEPIFGHQTPDGWPLDTASWSGSGQLAKRFEIARSIGNGYAPLFTDEGNKTRNAGFPLLTTQHYYTAFEPTLSATTRAALAKATSQQEWNTFLLASPEFNYR